MMHDEFICSDWSNAKPQDLTLTELTALMLLKMAIVQRFPSFDAYLKCAK